VQTVEDFAIEPVDQAFPLLTGSSELPPLPRAFKQELERRSNKFRQWFAVLNTKPELRPAVQLAFKEWLATSGGLTDTLLIPN
jgi:hypothetical protein